jgi:arylsulfatase
LLANPTAPWPDRVLFTHFGRWAKGADRDTAKYRAASVRVPRWHLVSQTGARGPKWMLFDVSQDYGETKDVQADHPEVVSDLTGQFEEWWKSLEPALVNERATGPRVNPFKERYWRQFGGGPSEEDLRLMDMGRNPATRPAQAN